MGGKARSSLFLAGRRLQLVKEFRHFGERGVEELLLVDFGGTRRGVNVRGHISAMKMFLKLG